jgi:adenine-specific DNA-methyltransferase
MNTWNPISPRSWADALGLAYVPLFPANRTNSPDEHAVLLDGAKASFHVVATSDSDVIQSDRNLQWSWSSNVLHSVAIDTRRGSLFLRRWDAPDHVRKFKLPTRKVGADELVDLIRSGAPPKAADVILHVLRAFRAIRALIDDAVVSLQLFNLCLTVAEGVERQKTTATDVSACVTFRDLRELARNSDLTRELLAAHADDLPEYALNQNLGVLLDYFLSPEPQQQYQLNPSLLLRHASGQLYQEAHLVLEREETQTLIPGVLAAARGKLNRRDVRFTPPTLARSLVEQALSLDGVLTDAGESLHIIDPACGSGVFLVEALRELMSRKFEGAVQLDGIDISAISTSAATFCLHHAKREAEDAGMTVSMNIRTTDALAADWGKPDVILMNPPFMRWEAMTPAEQEQVREILGESSKGRTDKAMAFVTRAVHSARDGGVVASVLSAPMLESSFGQQWRSAVTARATLRFVGRFSGFGYFRASLVEPAFILLERVDAVPADEVAPSVTVLLAEGASEDEALRALRLYRKNAAMPIIEEGSGFEIFETSAAAFTAASWMPRKKADQELIERATALGMPRVDELFDVKQGTKTGADKVFILSRIEYERLPRAERRFFRPVASSSTITDGRLIKDRWVFFPYGATGLLIESEDELKKQLPSYFEQYLAPSRDTLQNRAEIPNLWWKLTREREWQHQPSPKIISATWGDKGSFAYDSEGEFVAVQGRVWLWRSEEESERNVTEEDTPDVSDDDPPNFHETELPWAYLALLNSGMFERLLAAVCPRVQGGQFDLSRQFVGQVRIPDLSDETRAPADIVVQLARAGRAMHDGKDPEIERVDELVARMYGVRGDAT